MTTRIEGLRFTFPDCDQACEAYEVIKKGGAKVKMYAGNVIIMVDSFNMGMAQRLLANYYQLK